MNMQIWWQNYLTRGFWGDEAWTALISGLPLGEILRVTAEDFHPPLYYFLVRGFISVFGSSEWIRLISLGFYLLTAVPVYLLTKQLVNKGVAVMAAILTLASPILFTYAFEARSYALVAFLSASTTYVFWNLLQTKGKTKWWVAYVTLGAVGVYTHYYIWFILAAHGAYWLLFNRKKWLKVMGGFAGILGLQLPWIPKLLAQVSSVAGNYWIGPINERTHWEFFVRVAGGDESYPQQNFTAIAILVFLLLSALIMKLAKGKKPGYVFLWTWLLVPMILPTLISLVYRPVFFYRYLMFSVIPMLMIILWGMVRLKKTLVYGVSGFILALYLSINVLGFARYPHTMREEMNKIRQATEDFQLTKVVTVLPSFAEVMYYVNGETDVQVSPEGLVQFSGKSLLDAFVRSGKVKIAQPLENESYWFVEPGPKSRYEEIN